MYQIFLDAVSEKSRIALLDTLGRVVWEKNFSLQGQESSLLGDIFFNFLEENTLSLTDIEHIYTVNGPGSFTGIRTIVLFVNTLAYVSKHLTLTPLSFFDLYESFPIVKQSSRRDLFVKIKKDSPIEVLTNDDFIVTLKERTRIFGSFSLESPLIEKLENYDLIDILSQVKKQDLKKIDALYLKKPNIS